jgi:hypothetical protein
MRRTTGLKGHMHIACTQNDDISGTGPTIQGLLVRGTRTYRGVALAPACACANDDPLNHELQQQMSNKWIA